MTLENNGEKLLKRAKSLYQATDKKPSDIDALAVAKTLKDIQADTTTQTAAIIASDTLQNIQKEEIKKNFSAKIDNIVSRVRKLKELNDNQPKITKDIKPQQAAIIRRMILSLSDDMAVILIILSYHLQKLKNYKNNQENIKKQIATETLNIYSPLANRLGIGQIKWQLEDIAFSYLQPATYKKLALALNEKRTDRDIYIKDVISQMSVVLQKENIDDFKIYGRAKHIYSIWRKISKKQINVNNLFDTRAVRIIVQSLDECYRVLGILHNIFKPIPSEFDDYIARPKPNGYASLHTVLIANNKTVEVQIRTYKMHMDAEFGVAAHWKYKEEGNNNKNTWKKTIQSVKEIATSKIDDDSLLSEINTNLFLSRVFVFSPAGEVYDLPKGSTALDFAYVVHTNLGHRCKGTIVNGKITSLNKELQNGDTIRILQEKNATPNRNWMNENSGYLFSAKARAKVRSWFNNIDNDKNIEEGRAIFEKESDKTKSTLTKMLDIFKIDNDITFFKKLGSGQISQEQLIDATTRAHKPIVEKKQNKKKIPHVVDKTKISVAGVDNLLISYPKCCDATINDDIVGFITHERGVVIHKADCSNILNLDEKQTERLIPVHWNFEHQEQITSMITILSYRRQNIINDITYVCNKSNLQINNINSSKQQDNKIMIKIDVTANDSAQLDALIHKLSAIINIISVVKG
jgi:GTP pyrophosphokinase